jgi:hypothetical protein
VDSQWRLKKYGKVGGGAEVDGGRRLDNDEALVGWLVGWLWNFALLDVTYFPYVAVVFPPFSFSKTWLDQELFPLGVGESWR